MKKIIIPIGLLLITHSVQAQLTPGENYIQSKTYLDYNGTTPTKTSETVQYFDGLGRPKQIVNVKASPLGKDVVTHIEYDGFGRQVKDYLPVPQAGTLNGAIVPTPLANATNTPYGSEKIYAEKILENSPLDRIQQQIQVGNDWSSKPVKFDYDANVWEDYVRKYETTTTWVDGRTETSVQLLQYFQASQLYKSTVTDEDGNKTIEFKNGKGQLLLVRKVLNATQNTDTYYVYNEYDQLAFVIPPLASAPTVETATVENLYYQYRYDGRNRLVEKKLPGKGWEYMVYDKQDRLIATRDTNLKDLNQWMYTKYDQFSRVIMTGICIGYGNTRIEEQNYADTRGSNNEMRYPNKQMDYSGMDVYYSVNQGYPQYDKVYNFLSINYYDTYPVGAPATPSQILGENVLPENTQNSSISTKGLPTASYVKNTEASDYGWTKNYTYYDTKGRAIGSHSINYLGGYTKTESKLDFSGVPQETYTTHLRRPNEEAISIKERFVYDTQNRLLKHYHQVDNWKEQLLADNSYNELSQLSNKKVGSVNGGAPLQSIDYAYNIRGWMTDINKDQMTVPNLGGKLFSYKIKYNQKNGITNPDPVLFAGKDVQPKYNGNIAEVDWRAVESLGANPPLEPKRYGYAYDSLNRLTAGYYQNPNNTGSKENTESLDYDLNGNITNLYRTSVMENGNTTATVIDKLSYTYVGNQAVKIKDNSNNKTGYEGTAGYPIDYDVNGNMKSMIDKQITGISYNYLNLPSVLNIGFDPITTQIKTNYRADGVKLRKETLKTSTGVASTTWTKEITDYLDGFQYLSTKSSGGGASEMFSLAPMETKQALEMQAFRIGPPIDIDPIPIDPIIVNPHNPELQFFPTAEGFYDYQRKMYIYQYEDHLGNVRVSYTRSNTTGGVEITDANDYYPFGMNHLKTGNAYFGAGKYQNYKYNGKELQETGMYDYGARMYMSDLGRWGVVDAFTEKYPDLSGYSHVANDPVNAIEIDGNDFVYVNEDGTIRKVVRNDSPYITVIYRGKGILLSDLDTSTNWFGYGNDVNQKIIANVVGYYGRNDAGITGETLGWKGYDDEAMADTDINNNIKVNSQSNGKIDPLLTNKYNLISTLEHEKFHKKEPKQLRTKYNYSAHSRVYLQQMRSKNFKKTSKGFSLGMIRNFMNYLQMAKNEKEEGYTDLINEFNSLGLGYTLTNRDSGGIMLTNDTTGDEDRALRKTLESPH
jgi:RHS repeat-associated protein